jgi:TatA/E family protein of Tat protein translocase
MLDVGSKELIIIGVILVLLFGSRKLPEFAKVIARAIKDIRRGFKDNLSEELTNTYGTQNKGK